MYAIVEIAGQQFKVEKDKKLFVHHLDSEAGDSLDFEKVLLVDNDGEIAITATGGVGVTEYIWSHSALDQNSFTNLSAGEYTINVKDVGCPDSIVLNINIANPDSVSIDSVFCSQN